LLTEQGLSGGDAIKALVFLTIIMTVLIQGLTAGLVARWLGLTKADAVGAVVVGCSPLSLLIARLIQDHGDPVVLIDTSDLACEEAANQGLPVLISSALDHDALEQAGLSKTGTFLAMTKNGEVNAVVAQRALEEFAPPRVIAVLPQETESEESPESGNLKQARLTRLSLKKWNTYLQQGKCGWGKPGCGITRVTCNRPIC
jgi:NhaP-type Na+/H+ or K+/H+ antiporter